MSFNLEKRFANFPYLALLFIVSRLKVKALTRSNIQSDGTREQKYDTQCSLKHFQIKKAHMVNWAPVIYGKEKKERCQLWCVWAALKAK